MAKQISSSNYDSRKYKKLRNATKNTCKKLGIAVYETDNSELEAMPKEYICVYSKDEANISGTYYPDIEPTALFVSLHDYEQNEEALLTTCL